jgi:Prokaryotic N-terminal methylation motif
MRKRRQFGFSMLEIMIILAIGLCLMAMVAPLVTTTLNMYRLRGAGGDFSTLLQNARMQAVTADRYYPVNVTQGAPPAGAPYNAYLDINGDLAYNVGESAASFNPAVVVQPVANAPAAANLYTQFLPGIAVGAVVINPNGWAPPNGFAITFGPRGLPCQATAAAGGVCSYTSQAPNAVGQPLAFETFMQNNVTGVWEAVTVNPAGRVRQWHYDRITTTWRPLD